MTANEQIDWLNSIVRTKIAPSSINGVGLFALRDIPKGTKLGADMTPKIYSLTFSQLKKLRPEIREQIIGQWPQIVNGSKFAYPTTRIQTYINHSEDPNYNPFTDLTIRDIKEGEEITENYRHFKGYEQAHPWLVDKKVVL